MGTITIQAGNEYKTSFVNIYNNNEFLYPEYFLAARCINEIVTASIQYSVRNESSEYKTNIPEYDCQSHSIGFVPTEDQQLRGYPNNIIAFCARRGQGKTSCMLSVSKALSLLPVKNWDRYQSEGIIKQFWLDAHRFSSRMSFSLKSNNDSTFDPVSGLRFFVIDPIDPSSMEHGDSLLRTIFLRMENAVRSRLETQTTRNWSELQQDNNANKLRQLRDQFGDTFRKLLALKKSPTQNCDGIYDDLTQLEQSGDSVILRKSIMKLIKSFLDYMGYDMLVIQIDDADLNSARAFEITEDIRNYCVGPHVIVLMALHLGTLRNCIEQEYVKRYEYLLRKDLYITPMERDKCRETAERYIDKLLPSRHQIHMPYLKDYIRDGASNVRLSYVRPVVEQGKRIDKEIYPSRDLQAFMISLVYRKTGVVLMPREDYYHAFMPSRFRELTHMLSFFDDIDDIIECDENNEPLPDVTLQNILVSYALYNPQDSETEYTKEQVSYLDRRIRNLKQLELYLIQHWASMTLDKQQWIVLRDVSEVPDSILFLKTMIRLQIYLRDTQNINTFPLKEYPGFVADLSFERASRPSYADVKKTLESIDWNLDFTNKYNLTYYLRLLFTIRLHLNAMYQLRYHNSLDSLAKMCGNEVFYDDPLNWDGKQIISGALFRSMVPEFGNILSGPMDFFEPITAPSSHGSLLRESTLTRASNDTLQINPKATWLRLSFNHVLFRYISDEVLKGQRRNEFAHGGGNAFVGAADLLKLICNYDMQHRLSSSLSKIPEFESSIHYGEAVVNLGEHMNKLYSRKKHDTEPKQSLDLGCNFDDVMQWSFATLHDFGREGKIDVALELANPEICLDRVKEITQVLLENMKQKTSNVDEEYYRDLMDNFHTEYETTIELLTKIPALSAITSEIQNIVEKKDFNARKRNTDKVRQFYDSIQNKMKKTLDNEKDPEQVLNALNEMLLKQDKNTVQTSNNRNNARIAKRKISRSIEKEKSQNEKDL